MLNSLSTECEGIKLDKMVELKMKYFVLKPTGTDLYAGASRLAMLEYARVIEPENPELAKELREWVDRVIPIIGEACGG
ncbi:MAG: hypothetical protein PF487_09635 [Bacteroidales bacterium]|jgi:hypothetical protein|nr:hypothetical protein [Bacteroidales bacterium]